MGLRWGIIGTGGIARTFAEDLTYTDHTVSAIGSRSIESARNFGFGSRFYGSYEELVHDDQIDAVYVATPHSFHHRDALLTINARKPVLVEKAFTLNARQAREVISTARENNVPLMEAMWTRFLPHIHLVRSIIESGELGEIYSLIADHGQNLPYSRAPRLWEPELGAGALLDLGVYPVSFSHMLFGKPRRITAQATLSDKGMDTQISGILESEKGAQTSLHATMLVHTSNTATISGTKGRIELDEAFYRPTPMRVITPTGTREYENRYEGVGHREEALAFEKVLESGALESPLMTHDQTIGIMETMDEMRRQCGVRYDVD